MSELLQRLIASQDVAGASTRVLLVTFRDLGMTHAANVGVFEALATTHASASVAVPCPWAREASARYRGEDVGVQLTLNAQHDLYRWGPITHAPSLVDGIGGFPRTTNDLWEHADLDEVRRESRAQIERAKAWGFDVTHLVSHLDALALRPEFFDVLLDLADEFNLPLGLPDPDQSSLAGFPLRMLAANEGVLFPDETVDLMHHSPTALSLETLFASLPGGVTELRFSPTIASPEIETLSTEWHHEVAQYVYLSSTVRSLEQLARSHNIGLVTFAALRKLQRLDRGAGSS